MLHVSAPMDAFDEKVLEYRMALRKLVFEAKTETAHEASLVLPEIEEYLQTSLRYSQELADDQLKYHIVIGIGGSNLGTKAIYDAMYGTEDSLSTGRLARARLLFAETIDARWLLYFCQQILPSLNNSRQFLVTIINKSGSTTETIANAEIILHDLEMQFNRDEIAQRTVVMSDEGSALWHYAEEHALPFLKVPQNVGGRFSVFSNVGLFPLATVGVDVELLLKGAREVLGWYLTGETVDDQALRTATYMASEYIAGRAIHDSFFFEPTLESLGKWQRQLIGESIGKSETIGITPTVSIGTTDLHSMGQLYLAGPYHRMTEFVFVSGASHELIPQHRFMPQLVEQIAGKDAHAIMAAVVTATKRAYESGNRSFYEVTIDEIDAWHLGAYMQYKMLTIIYLGNILNVNTFDQPAVEGYKRETRLILEA